MAQLKVYSGTVWVPACANSWNGATWDKTGKFWDGSAWQVLCFVTPVVSAAADGDVNVRFNNPCYAGVQFRLDGSEWEYTNSGGLTQTGVGGDAIWLDAGEAADVWVERIVTVGSWNDIDPGAGRHNLASTRSFRILQTPVGSFTVTGHFKFWDAASGGNLLQQTASASYIAENTL